MQEIAQDNNKYCFGIRDTIRALEMGAISTLIVWDELYVISYLYTFQILM